jgi:hypothetical protein
VFISKLVKLLLLLLLLLLMMMMMMMTTTTTTTTTMMMMMMMIGLRICLICHRLGSLVVYFLLIITAWFHVSVRSVQVTFPSCSVSLSYSSSSYFPGLGYDLTLFVIALV